MKKLIFILSAWLVGNGAFAQSTTTTTTTTNTNDDQVAVVNTTDKHDDDHDTHMRDFKRGYIGGRAMATLSDWKLKNSDNSTLATDFVVGFGGGGVIGVNFSRHFATQLEVLYSEVAQKYKDNSGIEHNLKLSYINVPLLFVLNSDVSRVVNLNVCAGPQLGINTGSSYKSESSNSENVDTVHAVLAVKPGDIGFAYGIGLDFALCPNLKLNIGYRGVIGLVDISDNSKNATTNDYYILDRAHVNTYSGYAGLTVLF